MLGLALMPAAAWGADETQSITASPTNMKIEIPAGGNYAGSINIRNSGATDFEFNVAVDPYSVSGEDYDQSFILEPDMVDVSKWFHLTQTSYQIKADQKLAVPYKISVPAGAGPGGYYAIIFAETKGPSGGANIKSKKRVGIIFYLTVSGTIEHQGNVASFEVAAVHPSAPLRTLLRMKNEGNVHYEAEVDLQVKDLFGNTKAILSADKVVMPQTIRKITQDWDKSPGFGLFRVEGTVAYNGKTEQLPVRYTLMLSPGAFVAMFLLAVAIGAYAFMGRGRRRNVSRRR